MNREVEKKHAHAARFGFGTEFAEGYKRPSKREADSLLKDYRMFHKGVYDLWSRLSEDAEAKRE